jgi:glycosyltransferase involved in cell wall biosynthesis
VLQAAFRWFERVAVRRSRVVIVICPELARLVQSIDGSVEPVLIENAPGAGEADCAVPPDVRARYGVGAETPLLIYTGTFEPYQGLDLLFAAFGHVLAARPAARLLLAGGRPEQIDAARHEAGQAGIEAAVVFAGEQPASDIPGFLHAADVLVSPRSRGTNTPLKIYQYLRAGRVIVATRLLTHTQVLDDSVAILTEATPDAFAAGILRALDDPGAARALAANAARLAAAKYSYQVYLDRTRQVLARLGEAEPARVAGSAA